MVIKLGSSKLFFVQVKFNNRNRNTIVVSARALPQFTKILNELNEKLVELRVDRNDVSPKDKNDTPNINSVKQEDASCIKQEDA
jgi:hypothetical protein